MSDLSELNEQSNVDDQSNQGGPKMTRYFLLGFGGLAALVVIALIIAIIVGATNGTGLADGFRVIRDFLIVILALQGIFISVALIVLVVQLSSFINLLRNEIKPLIDELRDTATAARGTAKFVSKNVAEPVISTASTIAGVSAFVGEVMGIRRSINGRKK